MSDDDLKNGCFRVGPGWEILPLSDGSLMFQSIYRNYVHMHRAPHIVRSLLNCLDGRTPLDTLLDGCERPLTRGERARVARIIERLRQAGIVEVAPARSRPPDITEEMYDRFRLEIDFFAKYATAETSEFDYFLRLRRSHIAVIGVGGAGSHCAMQLAAIGVGHLTLIDGDTIELSNLVRQIFYNTADIRRRPKAEALADRIRAFTPFTEVTAIPNYIRSSEHARELLSGRNIDFLLPCADAPRILLHRWINEACVALAIPFMPAFNGDAGPLYVPGKTACFDCFENVLRLKAGGSWDLMVEAMQSAPPRQHPSFVTGPQMAAITQVEDCVAYLTKAWEPLSLGRIVHSTALTEREVHDIAVDPYSHSCAHSAGGTRGGR